MIKYCVPIDSTLKALALMSGLFFACATLALGGDQYIAASPSSGDYADGDVAIVTPHITATLYFDSKDFKGVEHAVNNLQLDIQKVTDQLPSITGSTTQLGKHAIIIGTMGHSQLIDQLVKDKKISTSSIKNIWEGYLIQTISNPIAGVESALVIAGADKRGTIYGIYDVSQQIGVSPWYWWADVPIKKTKQLYAKSNTLITEAPKVQYRGIFLNDEAPALTNWVIQNYGNYNHEFYSKVFELLLRLKANYLWPAMWNNAFNTDDPLNKKLADEYGIVMGTSHHEPMMRAHKEWTWTGSGPWDYAKNKDTLNTFWREGIERNKHYESIITLGMRGDGDEPMSDNDNISLLENIVKDQRQLISEAYQKPASNIPQVWTLYKEVQGYYEKGMRVPDDVTLLWADDNWGNIRRLPTPDERNRTGGAGVYYHFDYVGGPRSYRWLNTVPIAKVWEQLYLAYQTNARKIWIVNVGDLKPMEFPIEFFMHYAWNPEQWPKEKLTDYTRLWAEREFGPIYASQIADLIHTYTRHNGRRKPELQSPDTYSLLHYNEADRIEAELTQAVDTAERIYTKLGKNQKDAFYQLVLFPLKASTTVTQLYIATAKNRLFATQGRATAQNYALRAKQFFELDAELETQYHTQQAQGKWNHFMSQPHIGYTHWNNPETDIMPVTFDYQAHAGADMGIAIEGITTAWPEQNSSSWPHDGSYRVADFTPFGKTKRQLTLYNRGTKPYQYEVKSSAPWIKINNIKGEVLTEKAVHISVNWDLLYSQQSKRETKSSHLIEGFITIKGTGWGNAKIQVRAQLAPQALRTKAQGFIEADGYIAIEAANFEHSVANSGIQWEEIPNHGRTLSSISTFPFKDGATQKLKHAPYVEYPLYFLNTGEFDIQFLIAPTLKLFPGFKLRFAYSLAPEGKRHKPQVASTLEQFTENNWEQAVSDGVHKIKAKAKITMPGLHKLRIYRVDPAVTIQKIIVDTGNLKPSYLGPPESKRIPAEYQQ